eukprot:110936-Hanusia_phi.AAC.1
MTRAAPSSSKHLVHPPGQAGQASMNIAPLPFLPLILSHSPPFPPLLLAARARARAPLCLTRCCSHVNGQSHARNVDGGQKKCFPKLEVCL